MNAEVLGKRIRKLRTQQKKTLQNLADECELSTALISKIETGNTMPAIATLIKIANALGVSLAVVLSDENKEVSFVPETRLRDGFVQDETGQSILPMFVDEALLNLKAFIIEKQKGQYAEDIVIAHEGEELIYILEGEIDYKIGGFTYRMKKGDTLIFNSQLKHSSKLVSEKCRLINIFSNNPAAVRTIKH